MATAPIEAEPGLRGPGYENPVGLMAVSHGLTSLAIDIATQRYFQHSPDREAFRSYLTEASFGNHATVGNPAALLAGLWAKGMEFNCKKDATTVFIKYPFRLREDGKDFSLLSRQPEQAVKEIKQAGVNMAQDGEAANLFNEWLTKLEVQIERTGLIETSVGNIALR